MQMQKVLRIFLNIGNYVFFFKTILALLYNLYYHAEPQLMWSILNIIKQKIIFNCVICTRHKSQPLQSIMANLPSNCVYPSRSFCHVGINFTRLLSIKESRWNNARSVKCYISIFFHAVHIESVSELSTETFFSTFYHFILQRKIPCDIYEYTNCSTNFKGADQQL